jgi:hypothetical protein
VVTPSVPITTTLALERTQRFRPFRRSRGGPPHHSQVWSSSSISSQRRDELASEQVALDTQLTELHQHKAELRVERATTIDLTKPQAWARAVATTINRKAPPRPTFAMASKNVATAVALLDNLPTPSTDRVDSVYHQL